MAMQRVKTQELQELQADPGRVRNMCILAHVDHGKTTLSDLLVSSNGIISERQAGKLRFLDSMEDEQTRGITMRASAISLLYEEKKRKLGIGGGGGGGKAINSEKDSSSETSKVQEKSEVSQASGAGGATAEQPKKKYLINLIDSPGHIDFCSDVSTATRLCDGALVLVDAVEGVCVQTHAVLRQAWVEKMKPCLVLNKIDRLALELQLDPLEAYERLVRTVERVNALAASLVMNKAVGEDLFDENFDESEETNPGATNDATNDENSLGSSSNKKKQQGKSGSSLRDLLEDEWTFSPEKGNVLFASAIDGWAFSVSDFARMWAPRIKAKPKLLREFLWGNFGYNQKTNKVIKLRQGGEAAMKPMFVSLILDPIFNLYEASQNDIPKAMKIAQRLGIEIPAREVTLAERDGGLARSLLSRWLPMANAVLQMAVEHMPSPEVSQSNRITALFNDQPSFEALSLEMEKLSLTTDSSATVTASEKEGDNSKLSALESEKVFSYGFNAMTQAVAQCDQQSCLTVAFISKMTSVSASDLKCLDGKTTWKSPYASSDGAAFPNLSADSAQEGEGEEVLVAFARVFSGTLTVNDIQEHIDKEEGEERGEERHMFIMGPKYNPRESLTLEKSISSNKKNSESFVIVNSHTFENDSVNNTNNISGHVTGMTSHSQQVLLGKSAFSLPPSIITAAAATTDTVSSDTLDMNGGDVNRVIKSPIALYMMMGDSFIPVSSVPAGSLCAIAGLDVFSTAKCMTLVVGPKWAAVCPPFKPLAMQARPILRVAVEPESAVDVSRLEKALLKLQRSDPAVEIETTASGEQIVAALGELHLEQCLKELVQRHSPGLKIRVSPPIHTFREGLLSEEAEEYSAPWELTTTNNHNMTQATTTSSSGNDSYKQSSGSESNNEMLLGAQLRTPPWIKEEGVPYVLYGGSAARVPTADGSCALTVRVRPLPADLVQKIEDLSQEDVKYILDKITVMQNENKNAETTTKEQQPAMVINKNNEELLNKNEILNEIASSVYNFVASISQKQGCEVMFKIEACGPKGKLVNLLVRPSSFTARAHDNTPSLCRYLAKQNNCRRKVVTPLLKAIARNNISLVSNSATQGGNDAQSTTFASFSASMSINGATDTGLNIPEGVDPSDFHWAMDSEEKEVHQSSSSPISPTSAGGKGSSGVETLSLSDSVYVWKQLSLHVNAGFQLAVASGPLAEEEVHGVCFIVEEIDFIQSLDQNQKNGEGSGDLEWKNMVLSSSNVMFGFQVSKMAKCAFRAALLSSPNVRLVEGYFRCNLQCSSSQLRNLYAVLSKRRGTVLQDELVEGTDLFIISALLPVVTSSGFSTELLSKTSGAATAPLLSFSHWAVMDVNPFWRPTTEEERDEHGESYATYDRDIKGNIGRCNIDDVRRRKGLPIEEKIVANAEKQRTLTRNK